MAVKPSKADKKLAYDAKLCQLLDEYSQILGAAADNVGYNQLQNIRKGLRGDSVILMGKNNMMKRSIRIHSEKTGNKAFLNLISLHQEKFFHLCFNSILRFAFICCLFGLFYMGIFHFLNQGYVGLIFTKGDLKEVSEEVANYKVGAPARIGLVASFFQVLNIPTKINKGTVEIITPVELIKKGDKVGSSEAALLAKLGIRPFSYGRIVQSVNDIFYRIFPLSVLRVSVHMEKSGGI